MKKIFLVILSLAIFSACERKIDTFSVTKGSADFTKYIAIGNSLFAGYADAALYKTGQKYSIPNLIAGHLQ
jgi:nucleoside recognition membrane protein YjiH